VGIVQEIREVECRNCRASFYWGVPYDEAAAPKNALAGYACTICRAKGTLALVEPPMLDKQTPTKRKETWWSRLKRAWNVLFHPG